MIRSLRVGPLTYKLRRKKLRGYYGFLDTETKVIEYDPSRGNPYMTILHEALHGIADQSGVAQVLEDDELVVRAFENFICMLLKDNPEFAKQLVQSLQKQ